MRPEDQSMLKDVIGWDILNWSQALRFWEPVVKRFHPKQANVLTIGERNGGLTLWLANEGYRVICTDLHAFDKGVRGLHSSYGVGDRVQYTNVSVFDMPFPDNSFDLVACKSVIGGLKLVYADESTRTLENQAKAMREIHRVLRRGGCWLGAENMCGTDLHLKTRHCAKKGKTGWRYLEVNEWPQLLAPFESFDIEYFGLLPTSSSNTIVNSAAYQLNTWLCPRVPAAWKYISFVAAFK